MVLGVRIGHRKGHSGRELVTVHSPSEATSQCSWNTYWEPSSGGVTSTRKAQPLLSEWTDFLNLLQIKEGFFSLQTYNVLAKGKKVAWGIGRKKRMEGIPGRGLGGR